MRTLKKFAKVGLLALAIYLFGPALLDLVWGVIGGPVKAGLLIATPVVTALWAFPATRPMVERTAVRVGRKVLRRGTRVVKKGVRRVAR